MDSAQEGQKMDNTGFEPVTFHKWRILEDAKRKSYP